MLGLVNLTLAIMFRRGAVNTLTWLLFAAVVIVVYVIDFYLSVEQYYSFPIGTGLSLSAIIPILYLLVVWSVPQLLDLWRLQKLKQKEKIN
jgi:pantoate kinase